MTLTIELPPEKEERLRERAAAAGQDVTAYVHRLIDAAISGRASLAEILAPVHGEFRQSGMTEDELDRLLQECREEVWQDKQARKPS